MRNIKYLLLLSILIFASEAHSQAYTVKNLDCAKIVSTLTGKVAEINLTADVPDPATIQTNDGLPALLDAIFKDAVQTCRNRGTTVASWIEVSIESGGIFLYQGEMSAQTRQWKARQDARGWQIPAILKGRQEAQNLKDAAAREPASSTTQDQFCANFAKHRAIVLHLVAQRRNEQNPLRAQQIDQQLNEAIRAASVELVGLYGAGLKRFASYTGIVTNLSDAGFGRIGMGLTVDCTGAPIAFDVLFSNEAISDPPDPANLGLLSSLPISRTTLAQLNRGDRVRADGLFRRFIVGGMDFASISLTDNAIVLRVRITQLTKL